MNSDERILQILENSACLRKGQLLGYLAGNLFPEELRVVELHLSECNLCNDALEGMLLVNNPEELMADLHIPKLPDEPAMVPGNPEAASPLKSAPKHNIPERTSAVGKQKPVKSRNYSWVGGAGIAALLLLGFALIWQFELRNKPASSLLTRDHHFPNDSASLLKISKNPSDANESTDQKAAKPHVDTVASGSFLVTDTSTALAMIDPPPDTTEPKLILKKDSLAQAGATEERPEPETDLRLASRDKIATQPAIAPAQPSSPARSEQQTINKDKSRLKKKSEPAGSFPDFETGVRLYNQKKYASALLYLKSAESDKEHPRHWEAVYYSGLSNKYLGKTGRAKRMFRRIIHADAPQKSAAQKQLKELSGSAD